MEHHVSPSLPVPLDIFLDIVVHLPLQAVLALRRTSRSLCAVTHLRSLWMLLLRQHVLDQHVPCPRPALPLADLSAAELESLVRRAITLRRNWSAPEPIPRRQRTFRAPGDRNARVTLLRFLPGHAGRYLISLRMTDRPRLYLLQCWDTAGDPPRVVAELRHADGPFRGVILNSDPDSPAVLSLQSAQTETFSIRFDASDPECAFETETVIDGIRRPHLLAGSTLVTRNIDDDRGALSLWDLADPTHEQLQLVNPSILPPDDRIQVIHLAHDYALVIRFQSIEIYSTATRHNLLPIPIAYPLAQARLQWPTDDVVLSAQDPGDPQQIHLFVRFGSTYPWPVNILHHYLLSPNPAYQHNYPTSEHNLPYDPHPTLCRTFSSPVRLFGQFAMALGRYGTALWLDSHTDLRSSGVPTELGQRVAGTLLRVSHDPTPERADGASMLFGIRNDDAWTRIAMEEEAGRIAIGHMDGDITLLEY